MMILNRRSHIERCIHQSENPFKQYPKAFAEAENAGAEIIVIKSAKPGVFSKGQDFIANSLKMIYSEIFTR